MVAMTTVPRLGRLSEVFGDDDPVVYVLSRGADRIVPAGDTRRKSVWLFRSAEHATQFAAWMKRRHGLESTPVAVHLAELVRAFAGPDLTYVLDPEMRFGYGSALQFKAPITLMN